MTDFATLSNVLAVPVTQSGARLGMFRLPATVPPWTTTGLSLRRGQAYTLLGTGRVQWSARWPALHGGPGFHLWARVAPGGRLVNVTRTSGSFVADVEGTLELGIYLGMWCDEFGTLDTPEAAYARLAGGLEVIVLIWPGTDPLPGLETLAAAAPCAELERELARARQTPPTPEGWDYLVETGTSDIWRTCDEAERDRICLVAEDDQGIIRKPLDFPLSPATTLTWRWRIDEHPSRLPEDTSHSHDYISIALEFDNGRDLTWIWSSSLAPETFFACPIKAWAARETHYVVKSGFAETGRWCTERRHVHADVAHAMGPPPARIVGVWLIAVATFQHARACAAFEDIRLVDDDCELSIL
jgi:hypothetical protein